MRQFGGVGCGPCASSAGFRPNPCCRCRSLRLRSRPSSEASISDWLYSDTASRRRSPPAPPHLTAGAVGISPARVVALEVVSEIGHGVLRLKIFPERQPPCENVGIRRKRKLHSPGTSDQSNVRVLHDVPSLGGCPVPRSRFSHRAAQCSGDRLLHGIQQRGITLLRFHHQGHLIAVVGVGDDEAGLKSHHQRWRRAISPHQLGMDRYAPDLQDWSARPIGP